MTVQSHTAATKPMTGDIGRVMANVPGWTPEDQLLALSLLALTTAPLGGDILEIGSWCGRSTTVIGHAVRRSGVGRVYAIDLFPDLSDWQQNPDGSHSFSVKLGDGVALGYQNQTVWDEPFQRDIVPVYARDPRLLNIFLGAVEREGLQDIITPFRGTATMFADQAPKDLRIRLAFLDGDHGYDEVCRDIEQVERFLVPGGWIAFDDAFSYYDGVNRAIEDRIMKSGKFEYGQQVSRKLFVARRKSV